jgi:Uncharacterized protein conserved in bacteria (DUF2255)
MPTAITLRRVAAALTIAAALCGCSPDERRPGVALNGEPAAFPADWRFTDTTKEIAVQVHTPYLLPHSVTIWCAEVDGQLFVAASAPDTKRWPGWVDSDPDVRLGIADQIYAARLVPLTDADEIARVQQAYQRKYQLPDAPRENPPPVRYWRVTPQPAA